MVRVKTCGKSARHIVVMQYGGKPRSEQDQTEYSVVSFCQDMFYLEINIRVGRIDT